MEPRSATARIRIVPAAREHVPLVHELILGLARYEKLEHVMVATEADLERALFGDGVNRPVAEALIGLLDEKPVGHAIFFPTYSTFLGKVGWWLEDLFVVPEARGSGVGQALLSRLAAIVVERGGGRLEWVVLDWNEPSIAFYKKLGAVWLNDWMTYRLTGDALAKLASAGRAFRVAS